MAGQDHGIDDPDYEPDLDELTRQPSVDSLLASLGGLMGGQGWNGIEDEGGALKQQREQQQRAMQAECNLFRDVFMTPDGRKLLQLFIDTTIGQPAYPPQAQLPMDVIAPLVMVHDAQCNFVRDILKAISMAEAKGA